MGHDLKYVPVNQIFLQSTKAEKKLLLIVEYTVIRLQFEIWLSADVPSCHFCPPPLMLIWVLHHHLGFCYRVLFICCVHLRQQLLYKQLGNKRQVILFAFGLLLFILTYSLSQNNIELAEIRPFGNMDVHVTCEYGYNFFK